MKNTNPEHTEVGAQANMPPVLIADDDLTSRTMLAAVLKKVGYKVVSATDGAAAWDMLQRPDAPALVILDWMMPEMSGMEVLRSLRALETDNPAYVIMLTTKGEKADVIAGLDAGANDYLAKPFDTGELRARVAVGQRMIEMQSALVQSRQALAYQASHDSLTGMLNRRAVLDRLGREMQRARRHGEPLFIGICDIDHFKQINDIHGHQAGDEVLCGFARLLEQRMRAYDSAGRLGGEEFLLITPLRSGQRALPIFERLCKAVAAHSFAALCGPLAITISIGVAAAGETADDLLAAADAALYQAKNQGRNRVVEAQP